MPESETRKLDAVLARLSEAGALAPETEQSHPVGPGAALVAEAAAFRALRMAANAMARPGNPADAGRVFLDAALEGTGARQGILWLGRGPLTTLVPCFAPDLEPGELPELERVSATVLERGAAGVPVFASDAQSDPQLGTQASVRRHRIRSVVCMPIRAAGERIGVLYLDHPEPAAFGDATRLFLETFATLAAAGLERARAHDALEAQLESARERHGRGEAFRAIVTASPAMLETLDRAAAVAASDLGVLMLGESGTGKELLARAIHAASPRATRPFVPFNCAAVPRDLMESVFFGHVRGAFTGAVRDMPGLFVQAEGGTLFLDEIADLDRGLQARLLRVLQDGLVRPVGGERERRVDVRVLAATSRDLPAAVRAGEFREDLFFRLDVLGLRVPPLRERPEDVPLLVRHFLAHHRHRLPGAQGLEFSKEALERLRRRDWTGNIRELENLVQRACVLHPGGTIRAEDIAAMVTDLGPAAGRSATRGEGSLAARERDAIREALARAGGNKTRAARALGIHRNALSRRMERLGIREDDDDSTA